MSEFTKTVIVDSDTTSSALYNKIQDGIDALGGNGGTVIVESGVYEIGTPSGEPTVSIPSNVTLIGHGNVEVKVTRPGSDPDWVHAFTNENHDDGNNNITISGFKIVVACGAQGPYKSHLIFLTNVSDCLIEKITIDAPEDENWKGVGDAVDAPEKVPCAILIYAAGHDCERNTIRQCVIKRFGTTMNVPEPPPYTYPKTYLYGDGIYFGGTGDGMCRDSIVKNNHVSYCFFNMVCTFSERIIIQNNVFTRATGHYYKVWPELDEKMQRAGPVACPDGGLSLSFQFLTLDYGLFFPLLPAFS